MNMSDSLSDPILSNGMFAIMEHSVRAAAEALERFGEAAARSAFVLKDESLRTFIVREMATLAELRELRRQLRLRRDRKNWRSA